MVQAVSTDERNDADADRSTIESSTFAFRTRRAPVRPGERRMPETCWFRVP